MTALTSRTVLLINPPGFNLLGASGGRYNLRATDLMACPPMSLLYLATYLRERQPELRILVKDYLVEPYSPEGLAALMRREDPFLVGITCFSTNLHEAFAIAREAKAANPRVTVIAGGPHTLLFPKETAAQPAVDLVCQGEGEKALCEVVARLLGERPVAGIANIWTKEDGVPVPPAVFENAFENIDEMPFTDQAFVGVDRYYHPFLHDPGGLLVVATARGCPFRCTYCNSAGRKARLRSIGSIVDEIQRKVERFKVRNVFLIDDTFNITPQRVREFSRELSRRGLAIAWAFRGRANGLDDATLRAAREAGLVHVSIGVEDFTDEGLRAIHKGVTLDEVRQAFLRCRQHGVQTTANFIIGLPHNQEWAKQMRLKEFIRELSPTTIQTFVLLLIPGSELYDEAVRRGIISAEHWLRHARDPQPGFAMPGWAEKMSLEDQFRINSIINNWFYLRPGYVIGQLWRTRSLRELARKGRVAYALLKTAFFQRG
ncbi:MAG TPA: hypothetical protein DEB40_09300 [Elusimicrobia bacterium]|nr:hypothetical protein [Elusimicrobiota bacterium]HBT61925.1 hypothetical protein [Elusimicrobiota bacterium]